MSLLLTAASAHAADTAESWPELQFHKWFDEHRSRFIAMTSVSRNRDSVAGYQAEVGLTVEHRFTDGFVARGGFRHANATDGGPFWENRLLTEQTFHLPIGLGFSADLRTREDFRWLDTGFSVRLRERLQVQRDVTIGRYVFTPYASAEIFSDTRYDQISRYRLIMGVSLPVGEHFQVEPSLVRQVDTAGGGAITHALGLVLTTSF